MAAGVLKMVAKGEAEEQWEAVNRLSYLECAGFTSVTTSVKHRGNVQFSHIRWIK
jgi:hypothetical protein